MNYKQVEKKKKSKKRGLLFTVMFHSIAVILALYPFMHINDETPVEEEQAVMIEFDFGSKMEGAKASSSKKTERKKKVEKMTPIKKPAPKVLTTEVPTDIKVPEIKRPTKKVETIPDPVPSDVPAPETKPTDLKVPDVFVPTPTTTSETESGSNDGENSTVESDGNGEGDSKAEGEKGDGDADEGENEGEGRGFIEGNGTLDRPVVESVNVRNLGNKDGTMVFKICVLRNGIVDFIEFDAENSNVTDKDIIQSALEALAKYKFKPDYSAEKRQCGRYTYAIRH